MIKTPKSTKIGSFTGSNTTTVIGFGFSEAVPNVYTADFVNGVYKVNNADSAFNDLFTFNRASEAWLVKDTGLQEYAADVPRFDKGLLIEQKSTNYARWSFLPENGVFSRNVGTYFNGSNWQKAGSSGAVLYVNSLEAISKQSVASITATPSSTFSKIVVNNASTAPIKKSQVYYHVVDSIDTRFAGISWDAGENYSTSSIPLAFQIEEGVVPSTPIKTTTTPVTRLADVLSLKTKATSVKGDWDSTLTLSIVDGQLVHSGYGRVRSLEIS